MYKIEASRLKKADIILTRSKTSATSWIIRAGTLSRFSHAILYVGGHSFIDSDPDGVHSNNLQRLLFARLSDVQVLRLQKPLASEQAEAICAFARAEVGQFYDLRDAIRAAAPGARTFSRLQFCSRLVAQAYRDAGVDLGLSRSADSCVPAHFLRSDRLEPVRNVCRPASEVELEFASRKDNPILRQEQITNQINAEIHAATGMKVATITDWAQLALHDAAADMKIASILEGSGFLTMWQWDMVRCPEWYSDEVFQAKFAGLAPRSFAPKQLLVEGETLQRHAATLRTLQHAHAERPRATLLLLIELQKTLCQTTEQRSGVLQRALGHAPTSAAPGLPE